MQRFPIALYAPLQEYIITLQDEQVEAFMHILETLLDAPCAKYPMGGVLVEPNPHQEYADRARVFPPANQQICVAAMQSFDASECAFNVTELQAAMQRIRDRK